MVTISRDTPCLFLTMVTRDRLTVFRLDEIKVVVCAALGEARKSGGFLLFAYVIMSDHLHVITDGRKKPSDVLRFIKGIASHRVIGHLKERGYHSSLEKLRHEKKPRQYEYSMWQHHSNVVRLVSERMLMQRVNYIHQNPVRAGLVDRPEDYRWSSARCWAVRPLVDEPLEMDLTQIVWRVGKA